MRKRIAPKRWRLGGIAANYHNVMKHYEDDVGEVRHAERATSSYSNVGKFIKKHGVDGRRTIFPLLMPWGTPEQVLEKVASSEIQSIPMACFSISVSRACRSTDAERSLKCFARYVLPELKKWDTQPMLDAKERSIRQWRSRERRIGEHSESFKGLSRESPFFI